MNNILKTFEIFLSLPLSIIRKSIVQILHVETGDPKVGKSMTVEAAKDSVNINVVNNYKMYSLLTSVMYKKRMYEENNAGKICN